MAKTKTKSGPKIVVFSDRERLLFLEHAQNSTQAMLAHLCGVSVSLLHSVFARQPEFRHLYDQQRSKMLSSLSAELLRRAMDPTAEGSTAALIFALKTQHGAYQNKEEPGTVVNVAQQVTTHFLDGSINHKRRSTDG
ncbi:MAG: hypothetical protein DRR04_14930 [Gammaproteobacteria bacterium]|nr:MAG: hypothetical protein DRR04_14930 [Gammaproteobacteria bacterium]